MEVIRKIVNAGILAPIIDLPWKATNMQVEITVMPVSETTESAAISGASLKGCLKEYANIALHDRERHAWEDQIAEKYGAF